MNNLLVLLPQILLNNAFKNTFLPCKQMLKERIIKEIHCNNIEFQEDKEDDSNLPFIAEYGDTKMNFNITFRIGENGRKCVDSINVII